MKRVRFLIPLLVAVCAVTAGSVVVPEAARADFCENCKQGDEPGGGGEGGSGGGGPVSPPAPVTVTGTFMFTDFTSALVSLGLRPIVDAYVDVLRLDPAVGVPVRGAGGDEAARAQPARR